MRTKFDAMLESIRDEVEDEMVAHKRAIKSVLREADKLHDRLSREEISRDDAIGMLAKLIERCKDELDRLESD